MSSVHTFPRSFPLRYGAPRQFAALRNLLRQAGYTESSLCQRLGIPSFSQLSAVGPGRKLTAEPAQPVDVLIQLFLGCEELERSQIEPLLGSAALEQMGELGLLGRDPVPPHRYFATVALYPTRSLYLASDRASQASSLPPDLVYPAILENTQRFLDTLPSAPCQRFLDLGTGTGVAALMAASQYAAQAWACDITARSAHFAEFNRLLNAVENVTVACGDLYEPVGGLTFDRIVTHPPYVPVPQQTCIFRDGGEDGEQVLRRAIEGLPQYLSPGGRFYCLAQASDREGEPLEARIRKWLGVRESEFDVMLITESAQEPADFVAQTMQKAMYSLDELRHWKAVFERLKVRYVVYGFILIQRKQENRAPFTARVQRGPHSGLAQTEWLLACQTATSQPGGVQLLLNSRPCKSPHLHLAVLHRMRNGELIPDEFMLRVNHPFEAEYKCQSWVAKMIYRCDGETTAGEHFEYLKQQGAIHPDSTVEEFGEVLRALIANGFLEVEPFRPAPIPLSRNSK